MENVFYVNMYALAADWFQKYKIILIVFKAMNALAPEYITQLPQPYNPPRMNIIFILNTYNSCLMRHIKMCVINPNRATY